MKRANFFLTMTASALTLFASQAISAAEATAPAHAASKASSEKTDTLTHSVTKKIIESVNELSKTASKLSETALKLLEAQEGIEERKSQPAPGNTNKVYISEPADELPAANLPTSNQVSPVVVRDTVFVTVTDTIKHSVWQLPEEAAEGGEYIWIPDANIPAVDAILSGNSPADLKGIVNLNEMTLWRGDSIPMALPTKRLGRFDRKLYNWLIYPKGLWHISLSANYGELSTDDSEFLSLIQDVDLKGKIYSIKPSVSYFLRNNLCVGLRLAFTKGDMAINSFKVDIDEDMSFDLHDIKYTSDSYAAAIFIQQYFGLSRRGRFAVFNEAEVSIGTGSSHFIRPYDGVLRDTRTKTQTFNINYSPGVSIMMMKNAAFNLSFGIFGFHLKDEKQWENGEEAGSRFTSGINFRFNLFNINFGVSIII